MKINWNGPDRVYIFVAIVLVLAIITALAGCSNPRVSSKGTEAVAPKQAGTPAVVNTSDSDSSFTLPAGSPVEMIHEAATPAVPATNTSPAKYALPERWTWKFTPAAPTPVKQTVATTQASSGTVDTSVAVKEIEQKSKDKFLYFGAAAVVGALFFVWRAYPTGIYLCSIAAAIFFALWQLSNLPEWFQMLAFAAMAGSAGIYFAYERKEKEDKQNAQNAV